MNVSKKPHVVKTTLHKIRYSIPIWDPNMTRRFIKIVCLATIITPTLLATTGFTQGLDYSLKGYSVKSNTPSMDAPTPFFSGLFDQEYRYLRDVTVDFSIIDTPNFELGLQGGHRKSRSSSPDKATTNLSTIKDESLELGFFTKGQYGDYSLETRVSQDIASGHQGILGEFVAGFDKKLSNKFGLTLGLGTTWANDEYMTSYYGVVPSQSIQAGVSQYSPGAGFTNATLQVGACYQLNDLWSIGAQLGYTRLLGAAADSPTIPDNRIDNIATGFQLQYKLPSLTTPKSSNLLGAACSYF